MYELLKKSLEKYRKLNKDVYFITLSSSDASLDRNLSRDFLMLWRRMKRVCPKAECFFVIVESDGVVRPHVHFLVVDFFYPSQWVDSQWSRVHGASYIRKSLVKFDFIASVYFSTQHGFVSEVNCSDGWF
jgi:hypothetical protein